MLYMHFLNYHLHYSIYYLHSNPILFENLPH
nr:MAG TPA: hypothetical protein [Bacteriophage sp.]